jgi:hypothetical protein
VDACSRVFSYGQVHKGEQHTQNSNNYADHIYPSFGLVLRRSDNPTELPISKRKP